MIANLFIPEWSKEDAEKWKEFYTSALGQRLFTLFCASPPNTSLEAVQAHRRALAFFKALTEAPKEDALPSTEYPDLDDDSQWPSAKK